jgi:hypothetical protein
MKVRLLDYYTDERSSSWSWAHPISNWPLWVAKCWGVEIGRSRAFNSGTVRSRLTVNGSAAKDMGAMGTIG